MGRALMRDLARLQADGIDMVEGLTTAEFDTEDERNWERF